jgi:hypothetical protein
MSAAVIDFQQIQGKILEVSIVDIDTNCAQHWTFKTHSLNKYEDWSCDIAVPYEGDLELVKLKPSMEKYTSRFKFIFSHGDEKCKFIEDNILERRNIYNLEDFACPEREILSTTHLSPCLMHSDYCEGEICSKSNAQKLGEWCSKNRALINLMDKEPRLRTYKNWKNSEIDPQLLASWGFIHSPMTIEDDSTLCVFCNLCIYAWNRGDNPFIEHKKLNQNCALFNKNFTEKFFTNFDE